MSLHPQYMRAAPLWRKCRDAVAGQEAVHAAGETYLPRLSGQSPAAYEAYRNRALFYNATRRTLDGLVGLLFRRPPLVEVPAGAEALARDADLSGRGLEALGRTVTREVLTTGRCGMLVDFPRLETAYTTAAQAEAAGARPFLRLYPAEAILEWTTASVNTVPTLVHLMLSEAEGQRRRILSLTDEGYVQDVQQRDETGHWQPAGKTMIPRMNGAPLERIPFVFAGPRESRPEVADPPLLDLVNVNLSHYRTTADLEHGAHFTGLPTAVITGHTPAEGENLSIGGNAAWVLPRPEAKAYFLE